ncbi:MAG: Urea transporter [Chlorobi bacterium OLB4]|jgi:Urea transporter|nr:MAG: Urea transporter [Chlorobi bacterium OLB4]MBW7856538.1 urea transporter [Ignavibacteria bacterium]OQY77671.1 MAG: urea transporter [Ignavibacteriales bacterium UTCHB1]
MNNENYNINKTIQKLPLIDTILKGVGQIMLQENSITGILFLTGLFIGSWKYGVAAILATIAGTLIAKLLKYDETEIRAGLYGFSAALVGVALTFFFHSDFLVWLFVLIGGGIASIVQHYFIQRNIKAYTFPFILVTWILYYSLQKFAGVPINNLSVNELNNSNFNFLFKGLKGFGQVIFQGDLISGVLFFVGVLISSIASGLYGLAASFIGALIAQLTNQPIENVNLGLFGFNAILSAIVFSTEKKSAIIWVLVSVLFTMLIHIGLVESEILNIFGGVLTFPFVAGTWLTLLTKSLLRSNEK